MNVFGFLTDPEDDASQTGGWLQAGSPGLSGQKRGQPLRITQSQLREVATNVGLPASKSKPYFKNSCPILPSNA